MSPDTTTNTGAAQASKTTQAHSSANQESRDERGVVLVTSHVIPASESGTYRLLPLHLPVNSHVGGRLFLQENLPEVVNFREVLIYASFTNFLNTVCKIPPFR
jgi:hypothetical protein